MKKERKGSNAPDAPGAVAGDAEALRVDGLDGREARGARGGRDLALFSVLHHSQNTPETRERRERRETHEGEPAVLEVAGAKVLEEDAAGAEGEGLHVAREDGELGRCRVEVSRSVREHEVGGRGRGEGRRTDGAVEDGDGVKDDAAVVGGGRKGARVGADVGACRVRARRSAPRTRALTSNSQLTPQTSVGSRAARSRRVGLAQEKVSTATVFPPTETKEEPTCSGFSHSLRAAKAESA